MRYQRAYPLRHGRYTPIATCPGATVETKRKRCLTAAHHSHECAWIESGSMETVESRIDAIAFRGFNLTVPELGLCLVKQAQELSASINISRQQAACFLVILTQSILLAQATFCYMLYSRFIVEWSKDHRPDICQNEVIHNCRLVLPKSGFVSALTRTSHRAGVVISSM